MSAFAIVWVCIVIANYHMGPTPKAVPAYLLLALAALVVGVLEKAT